MRQWVLCRIYLHSYSLEPQWLQFSSGDVVGRFLGSSWDPRRDLAAVAEPDDAGNRQYFPSSQLVLERCIFGLGHVCGESGDRETSLIKKFVKCSLLICNIHNTAGNRLLSAKTLIPIRN
jgi:hypothetical protein